MGLRRAGTLPVVVLMGVSLLLAGCTAVGKHTPVGTPSAPAPTQISGSGSPSRPYRAILEWGHATIELPLDHFGMSLREQQLVNVAASIVFARCVASGGRASPWAIGGARRYLAMEPDANHWLFGYWDAKYLAARGMDVNAVHEPALVKSDSGDASRCASETDYLELEPISADVQAQSEVSDGVMRWSAEASQRARADGRFGKLVEQVNACVRDAGLALDQDSLLGGVRLDDGWSEKRVLSSLLVEATCRDRLDFTQQVSDIAAAIQGEFVSAHLAELAELRRTATERVARATEILREEHLA